MFFLLSLFIHHNQISVIISYKLKEDNFLTWISLLIPLIKKHKVLGFLDGSLPFPPYMVDNIPNPGYVAWHDDDTTLVLWIQSSIYDTFIAYVVGA